MKKSTIVLGTVLLMLAAGVALASGPISIERHAIVGGGDHAETGAYSLDATIGQPVVGLDREADYELCSGFRCRAVTVPAPVYNYRSFLPMMMRDHP